MPEGTQTAECDVMSHEMSDCTERRIGLEMV
jgi:hypothetical protein